MNYFRTYESPVGLLYLVTDGKSLVGLFPKTDRYFAEDYDGSAELIEQNDSAAGNILATTCDWLDRYFAGEKPLYDEIPLDAQGTEFRKFVWEELLKIPYGVLITYGDIAKSIAYRLGKEKMSAQAVGGAVGRNPISIIIPCHRVVGASGSLVGYGGGLDMKVYLLEHEGVDMSKLMRPTKGTALL